MKKLIFVLAAVWILAPGLVLAQDYAYTLKAEDMTVSWTLEGDQIHFKLSAPTTGWVAVGFDPETAMQGADIIIGAVKKGKVRIEDHYGDRKRGHTPDKKLGGGNQVIDPQGSETDGVTTLSFSRALAAGDKWDKAIVADKTYRIMVAYGAGRDSFRAGHKFRSVYDVNFTTGETQKIK